MSMTKSGVASVMDRRTALTERYPTWVRRTLATHFSIVCSEYTDKPVLLLPDETMTYGELWRRSWKLAKALIALGVRRRQHVAILMENCTDFVALLIALSLAGAVAVPLNTRLRGEELDYMLRQSDSDWLIMHEFASGIHHSEAIAQITEKLWTEPDCRLQQVVFIANGDGRSSQVANLEPAIQPADESTLHTWLSWNAFLDGAASMSDADVHARWDESQYPDEVAAIIYTSGSTGLPKGVMMTHDMMLRSGFATCLSRALEAGRRIFAPLPFYHVYFLQEGLLAVSFVGGAMITCKAFAPLLSLQLMSRYEANDFLAVPSMLITILNHPAVGTFNLTNLYALLCCAAPSPVPLWQRAIDVLGVTEIGTGCGGTEASSTTVLTEIGDGLEVISSRVGRIKMAGPAGMPEFGGASVQYKVVDPDGGADLPPQSVGELVVRGNVVTRGYYKKPVDTMAAVDQDGWLRSGDLARIDENGYIQILGRSKDLYKVSGETVAPKEVEDVISLLPAISQVYIVGVPDALTGEAGAAFVELKPGETSSRSEIVAWCRPRVAAFKVPRYVWFVTPDEWPLTGTGKIQKFKLREIAKQRLAARGK